MALALLSVLPFSSHAVLAQDATQSPPAAQAPAPASADAGVVSIGGKVVMRLRGSAGGMDTEQRVDAIEDRLTKIVSVPDIKPSSVVVYTPSGEPPVIFVLGRRLITVDKATVKSAGGGDAKELAIQWAKRLQQILPRVDIRLPNEPEPQVPAGPPLLVTSDLAKVGGDQGYVVLRGKTVMHLQGVRDGLTAVERADRLTDRLNRFVYKLDTTSPDAVTVMPAGGGPAGGQASAKSVSQKNGNEDLLAKRMASPKAPEEIVIGGKPAFTITEEIAKREDTTPKALADIWAKNIRLALGLSPSGAPPVAAAATTAPTTPPTPAAPNAPAAPAGAATPASPTPPSPTGPAEPNAPAAPTNPPAPAAPAQPAEPASPAPPPDTNAPPAPPASDSSPSPGGSAAPNAPATPASPGG